MPQASDINKVESHMHSQDGDVGRCTLLVLLDDKLRTSSCGARELDSSEDGRLARGRHAALHID